MCINAPHVAIDWSEPSSSSHESGRRRPLPDAVWSTREPPHQPSATATRAATAGRSRPAHASFAMPPAVPPPPTAMSGAVFKRSDGHYS